MDGIIVVDKPEGWTSHDVVNRMRRLANMKKVGHLGTLDPLATGVLPLILGRATRLSQYLMKGEKAYDAVIRFGYATTTYDSAGEPLSEPTDGPSEVGQVERLLDGFRGTVMQTPPPVSAKKVEGTPAYKLARKNVEFELPPVEITIHALDITAWTPPTMSIAVKCSAGTYVRSIAHDLGKLLGCGAFLERLRRTESSGFTIKQARTLEQLGALSEAGELDQALVPAADLLPEFPSEFVDTVTAGFIRQGRDFRVSPFRVRPGVKFVKAIAPGGELLAIGEAVLPNVYHPVLVL